MGDLNDLYNRKTIQRSITKKLISIFKSSSFITTTALAILFGFIAMVIYFTETNRPSVAVYFETTIVEVRDIGDIPQYRFSEIEGWAELDTIYATGTKIISNCWISSNMKYSNCELFNGASTINKTMGKKNIDHYGLQIKDVIEMIQK